MAPAMPCKTCKKTSMERPVARQTISSLNLRVSWKPVNPHDCVWKSLYRIIMRTISQEEETIHYNITICWYTNLFLCLKQWSSPQRKQWIRNGRNLKRFRRGTSQKSEVNQMWSKKQGRRAQKFILPHWWTSVIYRMPNWRQSTKNTKVELYSWFLSSIHSSNDGSKSHGYHFQTARMLGTSSWHSICSLLKPE